MRHCARDIAEVDSAGKLTAFDVLFCSLYCIPAADLSMGKLVLLYLLQENIMFRVRLPVSSSFQRLLSIVPMSLIHDKSVGRH